MKLPTISRLVTASLARLALLSVLGGLFGTAAAQPRSGDLVMVSETNPGIVWMDWDAGRISTLLPGVFARSIQTRPLNDGLLLCTSSATNAAIISVDAMGVATTATTLGTKDARGWALDQTGDYVIASRDANLYRVTRTGSLSTFATVPTTSIITAMCRDGDSGDYIVAADAPSIYFRVDGATGSVRTLGTITGRGFARQIDWVPSTGNFVSAHITGGVYLLDGSAQIISSLNWNGLGITVDERRNRVFCSLGRTLAELSPSLRVIKSQAFSGERFANLEIWGDQNVSLRAPTSTPGSTVGVDVNFPASPNAPYCVALSFSSRGGIPIQGQHLNLRVDDLFGLTACGLPGFTTGFAGMTDTKGASMSAVSFRIPFGTPKGMRFYAAAAAVNASAPGGLDVGNVEMLAVR